MRYLFILLMLIYSVGFCKTANQTNQHLLKLYQSHRVTFFCEQSFSNNGEINIRSCDTCPQQRQHILWMPIVPRHYLAQNMLCYTEKICVKSNGTLFKGIACCQQMDERFQRMNSDLYNLVPEIAMLKSQRRHYHFGLISPQVKETMEKNLACHFYVDKKNKMIEPSPESRGIIARTYLYMRDKYHLSLSHEESELFHTWHLQYPPTSWERERNDKIRVIQGEGNHYYN